VLAGTTDINLHVNGARRRRQFRPAAAGKRVGACPAGPRQSGRDRIRLPHLHAARPPHRPPRTPACPGP